MRRLLLAAGSALVTLCGSAPALAQPASAPASAEAAKPIDAAERREVRERLAASLESDFVFPETGARYAAMLREKLASGAYDGLTDPTAFGEKVTADLQARDGHLRVSVKSAAATGWDWEAKGVAPDVAVPRPWTRR